MLNQYIPNPGVQSLVLHNTCHWQVSELMGGLACELLRKVRVVNDKDRQTHGLSLHACYPSLFMQGDEATEFLRELSDAQKRHNPAAIEQLLLSAYEQVLQ